MLGKQTYQHTKRIILKGQASLLLTFSQSLLKLMSIESMILSNHLILIHPLLILPSIFPSIRVFSSELVIYQTFRVDFL